MKALNLSMQAFGPYLNKVNIDFSLLKNKLFLITGPTGSGKTTILDGICFSLFCKSTGARRSFIDMRNAAADKKTPTDICFDFELNDDIYRFHRCIKPSKSRKTNDIKFKEEHECLKFDNNINDWSLLLSGSESKVRAIAQDLLGLNCEQFSQVIVLPQGEFRKLLLSNSNDKLKIFQTLFKTQRFELITNSALELSKEIKKNCEINLSKYELILNQESVDSQDALHKKLKEYNLTLKNLNHDILLLQKKLADLNDKLIKKQKLLLLFDEFDDLNIKLQNMNSKKNKFDDLNKKLSFLISLKTIYPYWSNYNNLNKNYQDSLNRFKICFNNLISSYQEYLSNLKTDSEKTNLKELLILNSNKISKFDDLLKNIYKINELHNDIKNKKLKLENYSELLLKHQQNLKLLLKKQNNLNSDLDNIRTLKVKLPEYKMNFSELNKKYENSIKFNKLNEQITKLNKSIKELSSQIATKQQSLCDIEAKIEDINIKEQNNIAYSLAKNLKPGKPCPVCGALHHPNTATFINSPDVSDSKLLQTQKSSLQNEISDLKINLAKQKTELDIKNKNLSELDLNLCDDILIQTTIKNNLDSLTSKICSLYNLTPDNKLNDTYFNQILSHLETTESLKIKSISLIDNDIKNIENEINTYNDKIHSTELELSSKTSSLNALNDQLPNTLKSYSPIAIKNNLEKKRYDLISQNNTLNSQIQNLENVLATSLNKLNICFERTGSSLKNLCSLLNDYYISQNLLKEQLIKLNLSLFDISSNASLYKNLDDEIYFIKDSIAKYNTEKNIILTHLNELSQKLSDTSKPDISHIKAEIKSTDELLNLKIESLGKLKHNLKTCKASVKTLNTINKEAKSLTEQYSKAAKISGMLNGSNAYKIPFKMYALSLMLEDILNCSNIYLSRLSQNRYKFKHKSIKAISRGFNGLDIEIFDAYFGSCRSIETLSGGEMFLASLALSFGLSDVVQNYSGGVYIDSIFIDEGFGSLDEETLSTALNALLLIQKTGRTVGIISHVTELKSFISNKIQISKSLDGQSILKLVMT